MINKIWQWLKKLWFGLFGYYRGRNGNEPWEWDNSINSELSRIDRDEQSNHIKDQDLAFLFNQLLEGVVNGWQENRIEQFFEKLEPRITIEVWLDWLQKYRNQLLSSSAPNYQLAARMIILGEQTASLPFVRPVGDLAYQIGEELLHDSHNNLLVESLRSHLTGKNKHSAHNGNHNGIIHNSVDGQPNLNEQIMVKDVENVSSLGEILHLLQNDSHFAEVTARKLGLNSTDPGIILEKLVQSSEPNTVAQPLYHSISTPTESNTKNAQNTSAIEKNQSANEINWLDNWFNTGLEKAQQGDLEGAIACWDKILELDPNVAQAWHNRGSALAYLDRLEEAVESFDQAINLNVNDYQSWNDRGNALYNLKRWEEAIISWDRVIGVQPSYYQAWYNRGMALEKLELWQEAGESYQQALQIDPDFTQAQHRYQKLIDRKLVKPPKN